MIELWLGTELESGDLGSRSELMRVAVAFKPRKGFLGRRASRSDAWNVEDARRGGQASRRGTAGVGERGFRLPWVETHGYLRVRGMRVLGGAYLACAHVVVTRYRAREQG